VKLEIHLLALLRRRGLYAECKGADLDALQKLGLLQWCDARSSTTPFREDLRAFLKLHGISCRIDYAWVAAASENYRELVGPEVSARVGAIDEIERAVNIGPSPGARLVEQTRSGPRSSDDKLSRSRSLIAANTANGMVRPCPRPSSE